MMDTVHVRRHYEEPKLSINTQRETDIAVVEHGCSVEKNLEDKHGQARWPDQDHSRQFNNHG